MAKLEAQLTTEDKLLLDEVIKLDKQRRQAENVKHNLETELAWIQGTINTVNTLREILLRQVKDGDLMECYNQLRHVHGLVKGL
jgi:small-conductance mechanosensitive channel